MAKRLRKLIPQAKGDRVFHQRQDPITGHHTTWVSKDLEIPTKRVCAVCNNGWMNELDTRAIPFIGPMIQGRGKKLREKDQQCVAAWAAKTTLAFHLVAPAENPGAPIDHYREIEVSKLPPRWTRVWLAAYEDLPRVGFQQGYVMTVDDAHCHAATILVGHLIVQVFGNVGQEEVPWESPAWDKALLRIWPYEGIVDWPPLVIGERNLKGITERFIVGGTVAG